jgi:hypothetical protein
MRGEEYRLSGVKTKKTDVYVTSVHFFIKDRITRFSKALIDFFR